MTPSSSPQASPDDLATQIGALSPQKRRLLDLKLRKQVLRKTGGTILRKSRGNAAPLSFSQRILWFLHQLDKDSPVYNVYRAWRFRGALDVDSIERAINTVVERHAVLRSTFKATGEELIQVSANSLRVPLSIINLQGLPSSERETKSVELAVADAKRPFDLSTGPLFRATLIRRAADDHVLILNLHHIVTDGWSLGVLHRELAALYEAFVAGKPSPLADLSIQYSDYSIWQRERLDGGEIEQQLAFWKLQLAGLPALEIPTDRPRSKTLSHHGARDTFQISDKLTAQLKALSHREGSTLFMTLLAALKIVLFRYAGQKDIVVGTPIANRTFVDLEPLIGMVVNMLVLRTDLGGDPSFRELLGRVRDMSLEAFAHQDLPFGKLVEELQPDREFNRNPFFEVMFSMQNTPDQILVLPGLSTAPFMMGSVSPFGIGNDTSKFDLTVFMIEVDGALTGMFEYSTDLFDRASIQHMAGHLQSILEGIVADPEQRLSDLPLLTKAERHELLVERNNTHVDYPRDLCVHQLVEAQVERSPDAVSVIFGDSQLTYWELNRRANQIAHHLLKLGVGPKSLVGICLERSPEMVVALLGVLKAGGAYVPLDPVYPDERLNHMLRDAQCAVLLTQKRLGERFSEYSHHVVSIDSEWAMEDSENPESEVTSRDLAYVIYTSGSTGKPKGVQIEHRSVVNFLLSMGFKPGMTETDTLLSVTTLSFDIAVLELFLPLITGARSVLVSRETASDGTALLKELEDSGASIMQATPATYRMLVDAGWEQRLPVKILCGGEALSRKLADQLLARAESVWNLYGPTETTVWSAAEQIDDSEGPVSIGKPIANTQFYVLDGDLQPVPAGVYGELYIGGEGLARGYLNRPELTAARFIADPFSERNGSRLYRTGDSVRRRRDGTLEFLGRLDHQIKMRGFRIELGEIETVVRQQPGVRDAVVVAREDRPGDQRLAGYYVAEKDNLPVEGQLRTNLAAKLPNYMVPSYLVRLERLPLTPNGKVDRAALPRPERDRQPEASHAEPHDAVEFALTRLWRQVLRDDGIGISDDFFEAGGHSLLAVQLFAQIEKILGRRLPLAQLFRTPTVEGLARLLRDEAWQPNWSSLVAIRTTGRRQPLYLVHGAEGNVLLYRELADRLAPHQPVFGLQSKGLDGNAPLQKQLEDMASHYVKEILSLQPRGPYFLGGYCLGGTIALEMAQQMTSSGEQVALVALLETYNLKVATEIPAIVRRPLHLLQNIKFHFDNLRSLKNKDKLTFLKQKRAVAAARMQVRIATTTGRFLPRSKVDRINSSNQSKIKDVNDQAQRDYDPKSYSGRVVLFRPRSHFLGRNDPQFGWGEVLSDRLEVRNLPMQPRAMLVEPFARILADALSEAIEDASHRDRGLKR